MPQNTNLSNFHCPVTSHFRGGKGGVDSDHLGSSSFITDAGGNATQHLQYLPYGELFIEQRNTASYYTPYKFSAKEKDEETGYSYFGARYLNTDFSIWLSVDPMSDIYPNISPFNYCNLNPIILIDPDGMSDSPVFNKSGILLGTDDQGMSGEIIIAEDPSKFKQGMKHEDALKLGPNYSNDRKDMTNEAKIKTISTVLTGTELPNNTTIKSSDFILTINKDDEGNGEYIKYDYEKKKHIINLDLKVGWTVENVREVGGIHEFYGHGIMHWGDRFLGGGSHNKIYAAQMDSKYWGKSTLKEKSNIVNI